MTECKKEKIDLTQWRIEKYNSLVGELDKIDGYNCDKCKNRGDFLKLDEAGTEVLAACSCKKVRKMLKIANKSGLGDILTEYKFSNYNVSEPWQTTLLERAKAFCEDSDSNWFFIGGQVGCGKTHLCTAIAAHYIKAGREVKYMLWAEESKRLKAVANDISYMDIIKPYKECDVLYIDDFLKVRNGENPTSADINLAFEIINHRIMEKNKVTVISSEKTLDELILYDEATMSRVYQRVGKYKLTIKKDRKKNYRLRDIEEI